MSEAERKSRWKMVAWCMPMLLVLYVLSVGPVAWVGTNLVPEKYKPIVTETYKYAYAPLIWILERSETAQDYYFRYLSLWIDLPE